MLKKLRSGSSVPALENIQVQSPAFFNELTALVERYRLIEKPYMGINDLAKNDPEGQIVDKALLELLSDRFGFENITIYRTTGRLECTTVDFNSASTSIVDFIKQLRKEPSIEKRIQAEGALARGWADMRTGRLGGIAAFFPFGLYLPPLMLFGTKFTSAELAALILHEVGHAVTSVAYMGRQITTNTVLQELAQELHNDVGQERREAVFYSVQQALKLKRLDPKELVKVTNREVVVAMVLDGIEREKRSELDSGVYDLVTWEAESDQFSTRFGAGEALASAIYKADGTSTWMSVMANIQQIIFLVFTALTATVSIPLVLPWLMILTLVFWASSLPSVYDETKHRLQRIRNDLQREMKMRDLDEPTRKRLQERLDFIDTLVSRAANDETIFRKLLRWFPTRARDRFNHEALQNDLENLAANKLFERAALLRNY